jgi:hypothetical protein
MFRLGTTTLKAEQLLAARARKRNEKNLVMVMSAMDGW